MLFTSCLYSVLCCKRCLQLTFRVKFVVSNWRLCHVCLFLCFFYKSAIINPLQELTSACFFPFHAGLEPTLPPGSVQLVGVLYIIWHYMHMYCEGHPMNLSSHTRHRPQTFSTNWFSHILHVQYRRLLDIWKLLVMRLTARWQCNQVSQWCSLGQLGI